MTSKEIGLEVTVESERARATIVIVAREQFGLAVRSLDSVLGDRRIPFELVYVDAGSPPSVQSEIEKRVHGAGGKLLRIHEHLSPNMARNRALPHLQTEYVVFVDNDVLVEAGWLEALVACADETGCAVVGPRTMIETGSGTYVHLIGGELTMTEEDGRREFSEHHIQSIESPTSGEQEPQRRECDFAEFHTMLVRRSVLEEIGPLDEALLSASEHLDLCLTIKRAGYRVYVEPKSEVTYVQPHSLMLSERAYFLKRWSDDWNERSFDHFVNKWDLERSAKFFEGTQKFLYGHQALCPLPVPDRIDPADHSDLVAHGYAQTPTQLYQQMRRAGWETAAIGRMQARCAFAVVLFSGLSRACGKPFLCHAIGTASILLRFGVPLCLVEAGLMHAAYSHGEFPSARKKSRLRRRRMLKHELGGETEGLIRRYHEYDWDGGPPSAELDVLDCRDAGIFLMRMANGLEELLDLSLAYTAKGPVLRPQWRGFFDALAEELGIAGLAAELALGLEATRAAGLPESLRQAESSSYAIESWNRTRESPDRLRTLKKSKWRSSLYRILMSKR